MTTMTVAQKKLVRVTLDIMCYDDLNLEDLNWKELLDLEGDEDVYATIKDVGDIYSNIQKTLQGASVLRTQSSYFITLSLITEAHRHHSESSLTNSSNSAMIIEDSNAIPDEIWMEWELAASILEITVDYYIMEFL